MAGPSVLMVSREPPSRGWQFKSTGSFDGFLFSFRWEPEGLGQVQGGVVQRQPMNGSPEIERVALHTAILLEASKSVLAQVKTRVENMKDQGRTEDLQAAEQGSVAGSCASAGMQESLWLCPNGDRRHLNSSREGMLEGFSLRSYEQLVD